MTTENKYITVSYRLYTLENGEKELFEETQEGQPFQFISGLGSTLEDFENQIVALPQGEKFEITIPASRAYGEHEQDNVLDLPRHIFEVDGKFDSDRVKEGNIVPLMTSEGQEVRAIVLEIKDDTVKIDLNHPLAGADLFFEGEVIENRPATTAEIQSLIQLMSGGGGCCGGSCSSGGCGSGCGDDCGCEDGSDGGCGCSSGGGCGCH